MDKRFWGFLIAVAMILGGIFVVSQGNKAGAPGNPGAAGALTNHLEGQGSTGVRLVEYGDYQCPACGAYYLPVKQTVEKYSSLITFQFRNYPLYQIHPNAMAAARSAEAADLQGKFWPMHDLLYENQQVWSAAASPQSIFEGFARQLGLDLAKFRQDVKSSTANDRIQADLAEGNKLGIDSTPTFFLDGKKISNPNPTLEGFSKVLDAAIAKKAGTGAVTPSPSPTPATAPAAQPSGQ